MARPRQWGELLDMLAAFSFILRAEADRLDQLGINADASDVGKQLDETGHGHVTTAYVLRSMARWVESLISERM